MEIDINDPNHMDLEKKVIRFYEDHGFEILKQSEAEKNKRLLQIFTPTALYERTIRDLLVIHKEKDIVLQTEIKTHKSKRKNDMCLEMVPLYFHIILTKGGVKCLYVYRDPYGNECGFWCGAIPEIREVYIPQKRWDKDQLKYYEELAAYFQKEIKRPKAIEGTDDPYIVIDESEVEKLPPWENLIIERIGREEKNDRPRFPSRRRIKT